MQENGTRRLPPDVLPGAVVGELLMLGRTRLYDSLRDNSIPSVAGQHLWLVPTSWVLEQLRLTPEQLSERLPATAWCPPRKRRKGGKKSEVPA